MNLCLNAVISSLFVFALTSVEHQASRLAQQQANRESEIVTSNIADISGVWYLIAADDDENRLPRIKHLIFTFRKDARADDEETVDPAAGQYTGALSSPEGNDMPLKDVSYDGRILLIRTRDINGPGDRKELPGLMLKPVGDRFEGYWTIPGRGSYGPLMKLVPAKAGPSVQGWKEYLSREGKFSILLPAEPTTGTRPLGTDSATSVTYVTNVQIGRSAYTVDYFDLPAAPSEAKEIRKLFDRTRDQTLKMYSLKLVNERDAAILGYPGRTMKMDPRDERIFLCRTLLVRQRVYRLWMIVPAAEVDPTVVAAFFDSFKPTPLTDEEIKQLPAGAQTHQKQAIPKMIRVSGGVLNENATKKVQPIYPAAAKAAGVSGTVEVRVLISEQGQVLEAEIVSGPEQLRDATLAAVRQWIFKPMVIGNYPVQVEGALTFKFSPR